MRPKKRKINKTGIILLIIVFIASTGLFRFYFNKTNIEPPLECYDCYNKSGDFKKIKTILSFTNEEKEFTAQFVDSLVIIEGDIIIGRVDEYNLQTLAVIKGDGVLWENAIIPYVIQPNHPDKKTIKKAIQELNSETVVKLIERNKERDYVFFIDKPEGGCASEIGKKGKRQYIYIGKCELGSIKHEILHVLGFYHEQARTDRKNYIKINWENVVEGMEHNFQTYIERGDDGTNIGSYDYNSIMHYDPFSFSKDKKKKTIEIIVPPATNSTVIGQRLVLSKNDINSLRRVYANTKNQVNQNE